MLFANPTSPLNAVANAIFDPGAVSYTIWAIPRPSSVGSGPKGRSSRTITLGNSPAAVSAAARSEVAAEASKLSDMTPMEIPVPGKSSGAAAL